MSITLDELLFLVGRLDDAPGFDAPRERFRRFLLERVTDVPTASALVDECQRSVGEQRHRALQDLVVSLGRLLRFEITFGTYERSPDSVQVDGQWRSPGMLDVVIELRTEQTTSPTLDGLARAMAVTEGAGLEPRIGLCVVARQYAARGKLSRALADVTRLPNIHVMSVASLLALAAQVAAERVTHTEVVTLLRSGVALDFVIDLLDRPAATSQSNESTAEPGQPAPAGHHEPAYWVATIAGNEIHEPTKSQLNSIEIGIDVGMIKFDIIHNPQFGQIVHKLGALIEIGGIVFVAFDDEIIAVCYSKAGSEVLGHTTD